MGIHVYGLSVGMLADASRAARTVDHAVALIDDFAHLVVLVDQRAASSFGPRIHRSVPTSDRRGSHRVTSWRYIRGTSPAPTIDEHGHHRLSISLHTFNTRRRAASRRSRARRTPRPREPADRAVRDPSQGAFRVLQPVADGVDRLVEVGVRDVPSHLTRPADLWTCGRCEERGLLGKLCREVVE